MTTLAELESLARAAMDNRLPQSRFVELPAERVLAMIAVIEVAKATEQQVSYLLRYRDAERHPELAEALMVLRTALAALEKGQT